MVITFIDNLFSLTSIDLQENSEWVDWHTNVLVKRNAVENVYQWACGYVTLQLHQLLPCTFVLYLLHGKHSVIL